MRKILWKRMKKNRKNAQIAKIICTLIRICLLAYIWIDIILLLIDAFIIIMNDTISNILGFTGVGASILYVALVAVEHLFIKKYKLSKKEFVNYNN